MNMTFKQFYVVSAGSVRAFQACIRAGIFSGEPLASLASVRAGNKAMAEVQALYSAWVVQEGAICSL